MNVNFVTMGDEFYFDSILLSAKQAFKFHPDCHFYVYDWGFNDTQIALLRTINNSIEIITWKKDAFTSIKSIDSIDWQDHFAKLNSARPATLITQIKKNIRKYILFQSAYWESFEKQVKNNKTKEFLLAQKPFCMLDCITRCKGKLIFLDGDAFIVDSLDKILSETFDVGITLRRLHEVDPTTNYCQVLNSGVIFFNGSYETTQAFISEWINAMQNTPEYLIEQTSLTRLIEKDNSSIFEKYGNNGMVIARKKKVTIKVFDCDTYNFNWIEEGIDPVRNKIIHFKGGRHASKHFPKLLQSLNLIENDDTLTTASEL